MSLLKKRKRENRITFKNDAEVHTVNQDGTISVSVERVQPVPFSYIYNRIMKLRRQKMFTPVQMYEILETCKTAQLSVEDLITNLIEETQRRIQKVQRKNQVDIGMWRVRNPSILFSIVSVMQRTKRDLDMLKENYRDVRQLATEKTISDSAKSDSEDSQDSLFGSDTDNLERKKDLKF